MPSRDELKAASGVKLMDAVAAVILEVGEVGARARVVAARAGVSTGAIFSHWPSMADLIADACRHHPVLAIAITDARLREAEQAAKLLPASEYRTRKLNAIALAAAV